MKKPEEDTFYYPQPTTNPAKKSPRSKKSG